MHLYTLTELLTFKTIIDETRSNLHAPSALIDGWAAEVDDELARRAQIHLAEAA